MAATGTYSAAASNADTRRWYRSPIHASPRTTAMCRNIKTLYNFEPPATEEEIRASALQFVRKLTGSARPSKANEAAFNDAVEEVTAAVQRLFDRLVTSAPARDRESEAAKARERAAQRYGAGA